MNNMKNYTTFPLRFGIVMLMIFVWAMPLLADFNLPTRLGTNNPNKIDNPNIEAERKNNFEYKAYKSTIYDPFGNQTPSSGGGGNPANNDGNGTGEDVGIPDWGDTPSEPLPIADGTLFLLLIAATMITIIAIKQRKQKQLQSITTNNNNNPTQHMTTRKQTYQSFFQKLFLLLVFCGFATNTFAWKPIMIGHRGCRQGVENTELAFINGVTKYGFQGLECDVKVTKDGHYVCWHDNVITTDFGLAANCTIASTNLADIQTKTLTQTRKSAQYTGKICTVDRYLEICKQYNVIPVIELKHNTTICNDNMTGFPGLYALIEKHGLVDKAIILTSMDGSLTYIKEHYPHLKRQYLTNGILSASGTDELIEFCIENGCDISACYSYNSSRYVKEADVIKAHNAGIKVALWTMNSLADYNKYGAYGANFITSDDLIPAQLPELSGTDPNATKMIYFRPGTTNFSHGYQTIAQAEARSETAGETINNGVGLYAGVFWIKNAYVAIEVKNANGDSKFISKGIYRPDLFDDPTKRFLAMPLPEGYTKIAAYRLNSITTDAEYTTWTNNPTTKISNRIPIIGTNPGTIDIPSGDKNLLVNKEGWWDVWYWAYYLPKNNDVCIYFANNNKWEKVKMLTGKDIYTFPTAEFTKINGTELYYHSLIGTDLGYEYYGFINSNEDNLGKGWTKGLIPPVNFTKDNSKNSEGTVGNSQYAIHNYVDHESITDAAENTNLTNGKYVKDSTYKIEISSTKANRIANRIKDAPNYTGLRDDLLKGINLFTPSSTNGSEVAKTPITSWQDLNHKQYVTTYGGGSVTIASHKLNGATSTTPTNSTVSTGTTNIDAAYTATVTLTATAGANCTFLGWYDENWVEKSTELTYTYTAPNSEKTHYAIFSAPKQVRTQIFADNNDENKYNNDDWPNSNAGGTLTIEYTKTNSQTHTEEFDQTNNKTYNDIQPGKTLKITANPNDGDGYVFVGFWNNLGYPVTTNPWEITNPENYKIPITARFAKIFPQTVNVYTYNSGTGTFDMQGTHGGTVAMEYPKVATTNAGCAQATATTTTTWTDNVVAGTMTLTATAEEGYTFMGWYEGSTCVGTNASLEYAVESTRTINAYFAIGQTNRNFSVRTMIYNGSLTESLDGGTFTMTHSGGITYTHAKIGYQNILVSNAPVTFEATPNSGYEFIGWFNVDAAKRYPDKSWTIDDPTNTTKYKDQITAVFASSETYAKKQNINIEGPGTVEANYIFYNDGTSKTITFEQNSSFVAWTGKQVTLTATPSAGYKFDGWYEGGSKQSENSTYSYTATSARTITAKFVSEVNKLTVSVLNYDTKYNEFREYEYEYNTVTLTAGGETISSYSSLTKQFEDATEVTLTATPEPDEETGYDFIGWYQNDTLLDKALTINVNVIGLQAISAHFAPKKCHKITLVPNSAGTYTIRFGKDTDTENMYSKESSLTNTVITYAPYSYYYIVSSAKPILGYKFVEMYSNGNINDNYSLGQSPGPQEADREIVVNFVRSEDQEVYLALNGQWSHNNHNYYVYATNVANSETAWFKMNPVDNGRLYKYTIPDNTYSHIAFAQGSSQPTGKLTNYTGNKTKLFTIPATRYNCMKLMSAYNSSIPGFEDMWSEPPTQVGDFRLVYIEQTVDKNNITVDYTFDNAGLIKKKANSQDIISLHIYNKVSEGIDGMNNPEIILQRCTAIVEGKSQWEDVERRMIFGPLRATDEGVIRMPGRRNAATTTTIVYDNGIDMIKNYDPKEDPYKGSGVWNFVIKQDGNGKATILAEQTLRYTGDYYIRTTNAPGQYYQYTHPGNIMTYSEHAAKNRDHTGYTDYFIRYVDINEDGTATAEAGKHPVIKFAIANDHSVYLNYEFMMTEERFKDEVYDDKFVVDNGGAPNLPSDASVRFGWNRETNRLTRAYIANTTTKNNEYLVIEGEEGNNQIGSPSGDDAYFTDNSNWLYTIDLNATKNADTEVKAKVKAKMNGQYQYFMGSESEDETLISGNGEGSYPIRLLYDFKDDRFTTIYRPSNTDIGSDVTLETPVMIEREHNSAPTQIKFTNNAKFVVKGNFEKPAYAVMTFLEEKLASKDITHHEKMFYWISFPFDVKISDVFGLGKYGKYWIMQRYDGEQRAASGLAQNNWKYITNTGYTLLKNIGYVICLNYNQILQDQLFKSYGSTWGNLGEGKLSLYFPSKDVISPAAISLQPDPVVVELEAWKAGENIAWNHLNWHIIGVPSFADPKFRTTQGDVPFFYQYWHPTDGYAAVASTAVDFYAMHSYMVQYAGYIEWSKIVNTVPQSLAARRDAAAEERVMLRLELQQAGNTIDKTFVQLRSDKGTLGFDLNLDLSKIINAGANIYSVVSGDQMAGNAIPKEETVLPIGVVTSAAGEYTFAMPQGTEGMLVELIDYEQGTAMNLLMSDYTVTLPKGTFDQRFALRLKPDKVATSVDNIGDGTTSEDAVRKLLIDGMLYMQRGNITYDAQGRIVFER